jgi:hypothetical protein
MLYLSFSYLAGQENTQLPFVIPLHLFSCENEASLREPPTWDSSRRLLENFEVDGFVSRRTHFGALSGWAQKTLSILGLLVIV